MLTVKEGSECRISFPFMENSLKDRDGRQTTLTHLYSSRSSSSSHFFSILPLKTNAHQFRCPKSSLMEVPTWQIRHASPLQFTAFLASVLVFSEFLTQYPSPKYLKVPKGRKRPKSPKMSRNVPDDPKGP